MGRWVTIKGAHVYIKDSGEAAYGAAAEIAAEAEEMDAEVGVGASSEKVAAMGPQEAANFYQNMGYEGINESLREGRGLSGKQQAASDALDRLIEEQKPADYLLHRGDGAGISSTLFETLGIDKEIGDTRITGVDDLLNKKPPSGKSWDDYLTSRMRGVIFEDKGFVSTSTKQKVVMDKFVGDGTPLTRYGNAGRVQILAKGVKAAPLDEYSGMGAGEGEVLLPRGTKFKINRVFVRPGSSKGVYLDYHVEVVP